MRNTFKVLFYLKKNNLNKDGEAPIMARITIDGTVAQFSCKACIRPDLWETKFNRALGRSEKATEINRLLDGIKSGIEEHYKKVLGRDGCVTAETVKNSFLGLDMRAQTLLALLKQHNEEYEELVKAGLRAKTSFPKYKYVCMYFEVFLKKKYNRTDIALQELTLAHITGFELYLATVQKLAHNTIAIYLFSLKKIITGAVKNRLLQYNPFDNYQIFIKEADIGYLDKDEIKAIMDVQLDSRLEVIRDLFLFCTFTGLSFCDMRNLTNDNVQTFFDDNRWIIILIDGGTAFTYEWIDKRRTKQKISGDLKNVIQEISNKGQKIDLLIVTHVDCDHIEGILKWFGDEEFDSNLIKEIWFNSGSIIADFFNQPVA